MEDGPWAWLVPDHPQTQDWLNHILWIGLWKWFYLPDQPTFLNTILVIGYFWTIFCSSNSISEQYLDDQRTFSNNIVLISQHFRTISCWSENISEQYLVDQRIFLKNIFLIRKYFWTISSWSENISEWYLLDQRIFLNNIFLIWQHFYQCLDLPIFLNNIWLIKQHFWTLSCWSARTIQNSLWKFMETLSAWKLKYHQSATYLVGDLWSKRHPCS